MIATRQGTGPKPSGIGLTFLRIKQFTGVFRTPVASVAGTPLSPEIHSRVASSERQYPPTGVPKTPPTGVAGTPLNLFTGVATTPLEGPDYKERARAGASIDSIEPSIIDRLLRAKPKHFDPRELAEASRWVHGYQCKHAPRDANRNPPDEEILAQILTAAPLPRLIGMIQSLDGKQPGHEYGWYVTVALQRIHGIKPAVLKARRAELRIVRPPPTPAIAGEQQQLIDEPAPDPQFGEDLIADVGRRRAAKGRA